VGLKLSAAAAAAVLLREQRKKEFCSFSDAKPGIQENKP